VQDAYTTAQFLNAQPLERALKAFAHGAGLPLKGSRTTRTPSPAEAENPLTPREMDVLRLVRIGRKNREIAKEWVLSEKTIDTQIAKIKEKLGVRSRLAAVLKAEELHLFD